MFFSHLARIVALLLLLIGVIEFSVGFSIASDWLGPRDAAMARYFPNWSTGAMINSGVLHVAIAIALGTLAEIGLALRRSR